MAKPERSSIAPVKPHPPNVVWSAIAPGPEGDLPAQVRAHLGEVVISMKSSADAP